MHLAILLATYNSGKYLKLLLNSLFVQSFQDWKLYVHDDGSSDNTFEILSYFQEKHEKKICLMNDNIKGRGAKGSFFWLMNNVSADFYMLCDHDDIWLPNKVQISILAIMNLQKKYTDKPILVYSDLAITDKNYNILYKSLWKRAKIIPSLLEKKEYIKVFNCVTGCTTIFNKRACDVSKNFPSKVPMHDWWIAYQVKCNNGILSHVNESMILYCQHEDNAVGVIEPNVSYIANKIKHFKKMIVENKRHFLLLKEIEVDYKLSTYLFYKISYLVIRLFA